MIRSTNGGTDADPDMSAPAVSPTMCHTADCPPTSAVHLIPHLAVYRAFVGSWPAIAHPCDQLPAIGRWPVGSMGPSRNSWSDRATWTRSACRRHVAPTRSAHLLQHSPNPGKACAQTGGRTRYAPPAH